MTTTNAGNPGLFSPIQLRSLTARNRLWISPMCQYSVFAEDGLPNDWHLVHYGSRAVGGAGLILVEATAIEACGRISAQDLGLWNDAQVDAYRPMVRFMMEHGAVPGIQLAHAGRKAAVKDPVAPSALPFSEQYQTPAALREAGIQQVIAAFRRAALRASEAGFRALEIHAAHGYLLHQFLSPLANRREDDYGGSFENRIRLCLEVVRSVRGVWPEELPLFVRISATDWAEGGWDIDQSVELARRLAAEGVDLVDVSSGGLTPRQQIQPGPGYQTPFAERIRREAGIATGAVGLITKAQQADAIVRAGRADAVLIARQSLRDAYFPLHAARALGAESPVPTQYRRAW